MMPATIRRNNNARDTQMFQTRIACLLLLLMAPVPLAADEPDGRGAELAKAAARIEEIRDAPSGLIDRSVLISESDYLLMCTDCSLSVRDHPGVSLSQLLRSSWFAGAPGLDRSHFKTVYTSQNGKTGKWVVYAFPSTLPAREYQVSARQVAWYFLRIKELRLAGRSLKERQQAINEEATGRPWAADRPSTIPPQPLAQPSPPMPNQSDKATAGK
jgi:hypothetical protein